MTSKYSIVFFGTGPVALASLKYLAKYFFIEAVITKPDTPIISRQKRPQTVAEWAQEQHYAIFNPADEHKIADLFATRSFKSKVGVVVDYGILIPKKVIDSFSLGIVNSHFSLLPQWRGADPITFAVLSGQKVTGVSLMLIVPELDEGDLLAQEQLPVPANATTPSLTETLINLSNHMLKNTLPLYLENKITPFSQDKQQKPTYSRKVTKQDGRIKWNEPASTIEREVRAYIGWPGSYSYLNGNLIKILEATAVKYKAKIPGFICNVEGEMHVECGQDSLKIKKLQVAGKNPLTAEEFLRGYPQYIGEKFSSD
jgi:methionyl-tRNA formyltransferase